MTAKRRRRAPYDPAAAARTQMERLAREAEIRRLEGQGVVVTLDHGRRIVSAYRSNVFKLLLDSNAITQNQHNAATRLSNDWAEWKGLDGAPSGPGGGSGAAELVTDRMINAKDRIYDRPDRPYRTGALSQVGPMDRALLEAMMVAVVEDDRPMHWRGIVQRVCGEQRQKEQRTLVVAALENLRRVYEGPPIPQHMVA